MDKIFSLLGLAKRAGKIVCGESGTKDSVRYGKSRLVVIAADASENTQKNITDSCRFYNVPFCFYGDKDSLGHAVGNEFNAALSVNDQGFADSLKKCLCLNINGGE